MLRGHTPYHADRLRAALRATAWAVYQTFELRLTVASHRVYGWYRVRIPWIKAATLSTFCSVAVFAREVIVMTRQRICVLFLAAALFALPVRPGARADAGPAAAKASGEVNFQISCGPAVQQMFKAGRVDPAFVLVSRGSEGVYRDHRNRTRLRDGLLGHRDEPLVPAVVSTQPGGAESRVRGGREGGGGATKTEREKDYIAAIAAFYRDNDKLDHRTRALAYEKAMEQVYLKYPEDREAAVFYGLALTHGTAYRQDLRQ